MTAPASRPRPARRALDELSLPVDAAALDAVIATSPDWLAADRRAAYEAWSALPGESNLLYTPYIDLRAAQLEGVAFATDHGTERGAGTLPEDADGLHRDHRRPRHLGRGVGSGPRGRGRDPFAAR